MRGPVLLKRFNNIRYTHLHIGTIFSTMFRLCSVIMYDSIIVIIFLQLIKICAIHTTEAKSHFCLGGIC